jgi:hypothetical protein
MKKIILWMTAALLCHHVSSAQTFAEWFNQKATQKKYLLQQIAALKVYYGYAQKGYTIVSSGIHTIRDIKKGDINLHHVFFSSLKKVNPQIRKYAKVGDIIALQIRIIKKIKQTLRAIRQTEQLLPDEVGYCETVFDQLLDDCAKTIADLLAVITPGELAIKDDERLQRIDRLHDDMVDKYSFCSSFSDEVGLLSLQRMSERMETNRSKRINGIK